MDAIKNLNIPVEELACYFRSGSIILVSLILIWLRDRKKYLDVYIIASVLFGSFFLLAPKEAVGFQVKVNYITYIYSILC